MAGKTAGKMAGRAAGRKAGSSKGGALEGIYTAGVPWNQGTRLQLRVFVAALSYPDIS